MARRIIHVDMDEFFAAVEKLDNPKLRGKCVLVGGSANSRGVVSTASYEARKFGCHSAMPMSQAVRKCPQAIVVPVRGRRYQEMSRQVFDVFEQFTPLIQPLSIDEAFLDVSGCERLFGPVEEMAAQIKAEVRRQTQLTASVGVAPNMFLAKIASDLNKPDGLTIITESNVHDVLDPLPIRKLWGVGPAAEKQLIRLGVRTVGQLRAAGLDTLRPSLGDAAEHLQNLAAGKDDRNVTPDSRAKSIGQERTFASDIGQMDELKQILLGQVEQVARRLRRHDLTARTVTLKLRYGDFTTLTRSATLEAPTNSTDDLWLAGRGLFDTWQRSQGRPLRLLGFTASQLADRQGAQLSLFDQLGREKRKRLDRAVDDITQRFGDSAVRRAGGKPGHY